MTIKQLVAKAHQIAKDHGWWEKPVEPPVAHMLMVSELAEATEEARKGTPPYYVVIPGEGPLVPPSMENLAEYVRLAGPPVYSESESQEQLECQVESVPAKPEGELIELADAVIRIADYCGARGWDLETAVELKMKYNETRSYRHGNKKF